jgi:hypothetical protein
MRKVHAAVFAVLIFETCLFFAPELALAATWSASSVTHNRPQSGLVGYWSFDGRDFTDKVYDRSGQNNHGYFIGGATSSAKIAGRVGQGIKFDGVDNHITAGSPASLDNISQKTITAWVYPTRLTGGCFSSIANKDRWRIVACSTGELSFEQQRISANGIWQSPSGSLSLNSWQFVAVTYDNSSTTNDPSLYLNGSAINTAEIVTPNGSLQDESLDELWFGDNPDNPTGGLFKGTLDEVRIYNRILSASEIKALYNMGTGKHRSGPSQSGLVGWWKMEDGSGTQATDSSGRKNHGTLITCASTYPVWSNGKLGGGLNFDGLDGYVDVGNPSDFNDMPQFSISAWVYPRTEGENFNGRIVQKGSGTTPLNGWALLTGYNTATFRVDYDTADLLETVPLKLGVWNHLVVTWSGGLSSTTVNMYVNNIESGYGGNTALGTRVIDNLQTVKIGNNNGCTRTFDGIIDDVRIYNRTLTPAEVKKVYEAGQITVGRTQTSLVPNGLVGYWSFNGPDFTDKVYDRSGQNNHGYFIGGATTSAKVIGKVGQGMKFVLGQGAYIDIGAPSIYDNMTRMTLTAWINPKTFGESGNGRIIQKELVFGNWYLSVSGGGMLIYDKFFTAGFFRGQWRSPIGSIHLNEWQHVAVTYDNSSTANDPIFYINGVPTTSTENFTPSGSAESDTGNPVRIGGNTWDFDGTLDEVRVYNRVLSASEIKQLYGAGR